MICGESNGVIAFHLVTLNDQSQGMFKASL